MAQLFVDSFSIYRTSDIPNRWVGGNFGAVIDNTVLPPDAQPGAQVLDLTANNGDYVLSQNYGSLSRWIIAARFYRAAGGGNFGAVISLIHNVSLSVIDSPVVLQVGPSGTFLTSGSGTIFATGPVIPYQQWNHVECDFTLSTTGGAILTVYLNGNPTPFMHVTGISTSYAVAEQYSLGRCIQNIYSNIQGDQDYFADHYAFSSVGPIPMFNAPLAPQGLGNAAVAFGIANATGASASWTPNGAATIWQCIDQIPEDGDTTYASSDTVGQQYMCPFNTLPPASSVVSVQLSTFARQDGAGARAIQTGFYNGGTTGFSGVNDYLASTYTYYQDEYMVNPVTGLAWTPTSLIGTQYGVELTA